MATSSTAFTASQLDIQASASLREHAAHRMRLARDLARLLSCGQFNDLSAADFFSAREIFDLLLDEGYKSLQEMEMGEPC
jgi:hypothetical protein